MRKTSKQLSDQLRSQIETLPQQLGAAAKYIIDHPADFGIDPIRVTAEKIGVSSNVLVRLAQRLGYDGFDAFRYPFRQALVTSGEDRMGRDWMARLGNGDESSKLQATVAQNELNVVTRSLRLMTPDTVQRAVDYITSSRRCYVTATRASYALAYYFHYVGRMAHPELQLVPRHMGSAIDDLQEIEPGDCLIAITVSPYSADTIRSMRLAREKRARIILISDSEVIAPGIDPDLVFTVSTQSQHHFSSFSGAMSVLECLLGHLFTAGGDTARERVESYQKAREETGAYWRQPKPPRLHRR